MSIDRLQEKIRKTKNPCVLELDVTPEQLPPHLLNEERGFLKAHARFCLEMLEIFRGFFPAVRFSFAGFALQGSEGLAVLSKLLSQAKYMGYYVILEAPDALTAQRAKSNAELIFSDLNLWPCDGILLTAYIGSDAIKPYAEGLEDSGKSLFVAARTGNRSGMEIQDILSGGRNVHDAMADVVNRFKGKTALKCGYHRVGLMGPATSGPILHKLRQKYPDLFLLVDGYHYPGANGKNCAEAADRLGHGVAICTGTEISLAWINHQSLGEEYLEEAQIAADRMKKNLARYITVL